MKSGSARKGGVPADVSARRYSLARERAKDEGKGEARSKPDDDDEEEKSSAVLRLRERRCISVPRNYVLLQLSSLIKRNLRHVCCPISAFTASPPRGRGAPLVAVSSHRSELARVRPVLRQFLAAAAAGR